jgi:formyltetrahydrofolate-dependent phosphoribosylglycinamide formyltransferase
LKNIAVLIGSQGRGTNMANIVAAAESGAIPARVSLVVSPKDETAAVHRARALGAPVVVLWWKSEGYAENLMKVLADAEVDLICLAGYMSLLPLDVVHAYEGRIINIHPALLPKYGGKGMYGMHVHEAVIAAGETESGCSVHFVTERYDEGAVLHQKRCPVLPDDTPETLAHRVLDLEHTAYVEAINLLLKR